MAESVTKTAFAAILGVDRAQPTRWAQLGMPTQPDGTLDPVEAAGWVRQNIDPTQRKARSNGAVADRHGEAVRRSDAADTLASLALWLLAQRVPGAVAEIAIEAGLGVEMARRQHDLALVRAAELADDVRENWMHLPVPEIGPHRRIESPLPVDWDALAQSAAERRPTPPTV